MSPKIFSKQKSSLGTILTKRLIAIHYHQISFCYRDIIPFLSKKKVKNKNTERIYIISEGCIFKYKTKHFNSNKKHLEISVQKFYVSLLSG